MDYINKIEMLGIVGYTQLASFGKNDAIRFSLLTSSVFRAYGGAVNENLWINVVAWGEPGSFDAVSKGDIAHVIGRLRSKTYTGNDGQERQIFEISATSVGFRKENP